MTDTADGAIRDDRAHERFVLDDTAGQARLEYRAEPGRLVLVHTEVPEALGGRGIGGRLVRAAVARAQHEGLTVMPWCEFARGWLEQHPDVAGRVDIDWSPPPD